MNQTKPIDPDSLYPEPYCVIDNCLCQKIPNKNKMEPDIKKLCNFVPYIVSQITFDNGAEVTSRVKIAGISSSGETLPTVDVGYDEFAMLGWITREWGFGCIVSVGSSTRDHIRVAIQSTADKAERLTVYSVTGWKRINGKYHFLMPDDFEQTVELPNKMSGYTMRRDYTDADIAQGFSLLEKTLAPKEIMYPLLAIVFASPLNCFLREAGCEPKTVLMLVGKTGSKKSTLSALMLSFFGNFTASCLPLSFKDTANSIMHHSFTLKDVLTCIDDFHPSGRTDESSMTNTMQMILRAYGDRVGRGRLTSKSEAMETRYPQGNAIITAEFPPDIGESGTARYFSVEMSPGSLNNTFLTMYQEEAAKGKLSACMFAFTEWIRENFLDDCQLKEKWISDLHRRFITGRDDVIKRLTDNRITFHPRIPEDVSVLRIGFESFLQFLRSRGLIDDELMTLYLLDFDDVMFAIAVAQSRSVEQDKPVYRFIVKLNSLLESGRCFVAPRANGKVERNSSCIGYEDENSYFLFRSLAHQTVKRLCNEQGESFSISENALSKQLIAEHLVVPGGKQITKTVRLGDDSTVKLMEIPKDAMCAVVEKFS